MPGIDRYRVGWVHMLVSSIYWRTRIEKKRGTKKAAFHIRRHVSSAKNTSNPFGGLRCTGDEIRGGIRAWKTSGRNGKPTKPGKLETPPAGRKNY